MWINTASQEGKRFKKRVEGDKGKSNVGRADT